MNKREKVIGSIVMIIICTVFLVLGYFLPSNKLADKNEEVFLKNKNSNKYKEEVIVNNSNDKLDGNKSDEYKKIIVEIKGEVKNPNVYTMNSGSRVCDLVKKAGGFTDKADKMNINFSMKLKDEDCIIIYNKEEVQNKNINPNLNTNLNSVTNNRVNDKININMATKEELKSLPGIGDVTAQNIIDYREEHGGFNSIDELTKVNRIGAKTLEKFKDKVDIR